MSLTLVATAGASNANANTDVSTADALAAYRVGASVWADLDTQQKIAYLVTATRDLDTLVFRGTRATSTQALEWPRTGTEYGVDEIPATLVAATVERALDLAALVAADDTADVLNPDLTRIKREKVGPIEVEFFTPTTLTQDALAGFSLTVRRLVASLLLVAVSGGWGSARVVLTS